MFTNTAIKPIPWTPNKIKKLMEATKKSAQGYFPLYEPNLSLRWNDACPQCPRGKGYLYHRPWYLGGIWNQPKSSALPLPARPASGRRYLPRKNPWYSSPNPPTTTHFLHYHEIHFSPRLSDSFSTNQAKLCIGAFTGLLFINRKLSTTHQTFLSILEQG